MSGNQVLEQLQHVHKDAMEQIHVLQKALQQLRYEGRACYEKNLKDIQHVVHFFDGELIHHIHLEDTILFPYLKIHIPRLESVIQLLESEHTDFRENLERLNIVIKGLMTTDAESERLRLIDQVRQLGTYLFYLLLNHIRTEGNILYAVISKELKPQEKKELAESILSHPAYKN